MEFWGEEILSISKEVIYAISRYPLFHLSIIAYRTQGNIISPVRGGFSTKVGG